MQSLRIKIAASADEALTVMFEPSGMPYELEPSNVMYADIEEWHSEELKVECWQGGLSVWPPGRVVTRDAEGRELDRLY